MRTKRGRWRSWAPLGLFLVAQALAFFAAGAYAQQQPSFAFAVTDAFKTLRVLAGTDASDYAPPPYGDRVSTADGG